MGAGHWRPRGLLGSPFNVKSSLPLIIFSTFEMKRKYQPNMLMHACNPNYLGDRDRRITEVNHRKKLAGPDIVVHACYPSHSGGQGRRPETSWKKSTRPI
jgi:hypothetical protein